jgi:glycerate dehydrogenase
VISLHCPLNDETANLLSDREFALMAKKPLLINTARGGIVDEEALERALDAGHVAGAGIDVTRPEPPPADSAIMRLAQRPNVLVTPHVGWASLEAQQTLLDQLQEVLEDFVAGGRMNRLD